MTMKMLGIQSTDSIGMTNILYASRLPTSHTVFCNLFGRPCSSSSSAVGGQTGVQTSALGGQIGVPRLFPMSRGGPESVSDADPETERLPLNSPPRFFAIMLKMGSILGPHFSLESPFGCFKMAQVRLQAGKTSKKQGSKNEPMRGPVLGPVLDGFSL